MLCPNCGKDMIVVERNGIELDYCVGCKGFWFDNDEWDLLCERLNLGRERELGDIYSIPKLLVGEKSKKCPICNKDMEKFLIYNTVLDRCAKKHGIWFDANELSEIFNSGSSRESGTVVNFLGEVFAKNS